MKFPARSICAARAPLLLQFLLGVMAVALPPAAAADGGRSPGAPLAVRNLAPVHALFGLPRPLGPRWQSSSPELALRVEHANNFTSAVNGTTLAFFDGSTTVTSLAVRGALGRRLEWGTEVPLVRHDGGFTDGFIDGWHDVFGLPEGGRDTAPRDRLDYRVDYDGEVRADIDHSRSGLGDMRVWLGLGLLEGAGRQAAVRVMAKLPAGDAEDLSGSGGTDVTVWAELVEERWLEAFGLTLTLMGGVMLPGNNDLLPGTDRDVVFAGHLGLHYPLGRTVILRAQLDGHGEVLDVGVPQLAEKAVLGTLGGTVNVTRSTWLDLGVSEDLTGQSAPDVLFQLTLGTRL